MKYNIPAILFVGGKSSRMQTNKALLPFGDFPTLVEYQYNKLKQLFKDVYIITKTPEMFSFQAKIIKEQIDIYAPTAGFVTMFSALEDECFFVLGIDLPFVDEDVIKKLFNEDHSGLDVTVATTSNFTEAMCGIYHRSAASKFYEMLDNDVHKLKRSLEELKTKKVFFHEDWKFCNLNTPQEYQKALKLYGIISQKEKI